MSATTTPVGVQFQGIEVLHHRLEPLLPTETKPPVGFSISLTYRFDSEHEQVQLEVEIQIVNTLTDQSVGELRTCCTFSMKGVAQFNDETEQVTVDDKYIDMFISLSLSTTRGILFTYFAKTYLNPLVLPIINPKDFRPSFNAPVEA